MRRALRKDGPKPLLAGLLFFALLLRALIPAGFMIGTAASGAPALVLCPGMEEAPAAHQMMMHGGMPAHHHDPTTHEAPCPFGALAAPALPPAPPAIASPSAPQPEAAASATLFTAAKPSLAAPPPPATGPPAFA